MSCFYISYGGNDIIHEGVSKLKGAKVGSGRYPLGSGERPYQDYPERRSKSQSRSETRKQLSEQRQNLRTATAKEKTVENLKKAKETKLEELEKRFNYVKNDLIQYGSASEIMKYRDLLTLEDMQKVINRMDLDSRLNSYNLKQRDAKWDKMDRTMKKIDKVAGWMNVVVNASIAGRKFYKTFHSDSSTKKSSMSSETKKRSFKDTVEDLFKKYSKNKKNKKSGTSTTWYEDVIDVEFIS